MNEKTRTLLARIEKGVAEVASSEEWKKYLAFHAKFHRYSWRNTFLIMLQRKDASLVAGYRQWQKRGRQVRRGEKGIAILAPVIVKIRDENGEFTGERKLVGFRKVTVFDVAQTDGEPIPDGGLREIEDEKLEPELLGVLTKAAEEMGFTVTEGDLPGDANGRVTESKAITLRKSLGSAAKVKTLIHEMAHWLLGHFENDEPLGKKEFEAESAAFVVCSALGIETGGYSFPYIAGWTQGDDVGKMVAESAEKITRAAGKILEAAA